MALAGEQVVAAPAASKDGGLREPGGRRAGAQQGACGVGWIGLVLLVGCHLALALVPAGLVGVTGLVGLMLVAQLGLWGLARGPARWFGAASVFAGAVLLRLLAWPLPPLLSDDALRYLWDGRVVLAGANPYRLAPAAAELGALRSSLWAALPHRDVPTVYPPAALATFAAAAGIESALGSPATGSPGAAPSSGNQGDGDGERGHGHEDAVSFEPTPREPGKATPAASASGAALPPTVGVDGWRGLAAGDRCGVLAVKGLLALVDLVLVACLLGIARRAALPPVRVALYAWNPLAIVEVAGMGHVDPLASLGVALAILAFAAGRPVWAGGGLALGVAGKLWPLVLAPLFLAEARGRRRFLAAFAAATVAFLLPLGVAGAGVPPGLVTYAVSWEFLGPLFEPLWRLLDGMGAVAGVKQMLTWAETVSGDPLRLAAVYRFVYPQFLAKLVLAVGLVVVIVAVARRQSRRCDQWAGGDHGRCREARSLVAPVVLAVAPLAAAGSADTSSATAREVRHRRVAEHTGAFLAAVLAVTSALLLTAATVYPWYLLAVLPWAALLASRPWLVAAGLSPLVYLAAGGLTPSLFALWPWGWALLWGPPAVLSLYAWLRPPPGGDGGGADVAGG